MELGGRVMELGRRVVNSKAVMNVGLIGAFGLLSMKSAHQQKLIESLQLEKEFLLNSNHSVKKTLWDSKLLLYSEAVSSGDSSFVPLSRLHAIYNDAPPPCADPGKGDGKPAPSKILI